MLSEFQNLESQLQHRQRRRENENESPLKYLSRSDACLVSNFIASYGEDQITLPTTNVLRQELCCYCIKLAYLIRLLQDKPIVDIIINDVWRNYAISTIQKLRWFNFGGSWFDSLESLISDNVQYDDSHLDKLKCREFYLKCEKDFMSYRLKKLRAKRKKNDLTIEHAEIFRYRVKWFKRQMKRVESEFADVMENKKAIYDARESLNFFYPTT